MHDKTQFCAKSFFNLYIRVEKLINCDEKNECDCIQRRLLFHTGIGHTQIDAMLSVCMSWLDLAYNLQYCIFVRVYLFGLGFSLL